VCEGTERLVRRELPGFGGGSWLAEKASGQTRGGNAASGGLMVMVMVQPG
jgi:hypothetical protein